jgi:hypothetical protein
MRTLSFIFTIYSYPFNKYATIRQKKKPPSWTASSLLDRLLPPGLPPPFRTASSLYVCVVFYTHLRTYTFTQDRTLKTFITFLCPT